ncbi:MAG: YdcF family protein [Candidatus Woesearchaeota archaeon]
MNNNRFDAVVILGGGRNAFDGSLSPLSIARLDRGAEVMHTGIADCAIVMGGKYKSYTPDKGFFVEDGAIVRKRYLTEKYKVDPNKIIKVIDECRDTFYEAFASRKLAKEKGFKRILLVTSENHMRRALLIFTRIYGSDIEVVPVDNPCQDGLNKELESALFEMAQKFLNTLPEKIPDPVSWDDWFENNRDIYYDKVIKLLDYFYRKGKISKDAYSSIVEAQ